MSDQGFHEIQLSGKQLVFLFMAAAVLAVVIFLLGVSVGKGVRSAFPPASAAELGAPGDTTVPATPAAGAPAATKVTPNDLDYHEKLQGQGAAGAAGAVVGAAAGAAAASATKPAETPAAASTETTPSPTSKPNLLSMANPPASEPAAGAAKPAPATPAPTSKSAASTPAPKSTPPPAGPKPAEPGAPSKSTSTADTAWVVQLDAFKSKSSADDMVKQLKTKGYAAYTAASASLFKVRVGPFADRSEADKVASRLVKDGYKPLVTR